MLLHQSGPGETLFSEHLEVIDQSLSFSSWNVWKQLRVWRGRQWRGGRSCSRYISSFAGGAGRCRARWVGKGVRGGVRDSGTRSGNGKVGGDRGGARLCWTGRGGASVPGSGGGGWFGFHIVVHLGLEGVAVAEPVLITFTCWNLRTE